MKKIYIWEKEISEVSPIYIVWEIWITACGSVEKAKQLIDVVKISWCDAVKFHLVNPDELIADQELTYSYQNAEWNKTERIIDIFRRLQFTKDEWREIKSYANEQQVPFLMTCTSIHDLAFTEELGCLAYKIASWENNNFDFLRMVGETGKTIMIDTWPITLAELLTVIEELKRSGCESIIPLHCTHAKRDDQINLRSLQCMQDAIGTVVGYSSEGRDHTLDVLAMGLWARIIEKRLTLDRNHPEHHNIVGLEPDEFTEYVKIIRNADTIMGKRELIPSDNDLLVKADAFRGLVANTNIKKGDTLTRENIVGKRPLRNNIDAKHKDLLIGTKAIKDFIPDESIITSLR